MSRPTALVTGATAGIGNAFARELGVRGFDLVLVARNTARLRSVADELRRQYGTDSTVLTADLATADGIDRTAAAVDEHGVDLLVNNAGASIGRFFGETSITDEDAQLDLMVRAPMHLMDAALASMPRRGGGRIINVSSVSAFMPRGTYSAHKAWITNLSQWMNVAYADQGIVTTALCSGFVRTEFHNRMGVDTDDIPGWMWLDADQVVREALADLDKHKAVSVPSLRYKVLGTLVRYAPPRLTVRAAKLGRKVQQ